MFGFMEAATVVNVSALERQLERSSRALKTAAHERDTAIAALAQVGVKLDHIGTLSGLTKGRVSQIVKRMKLERTA